ncbi:MAG TPA: trehalose-phosphatase, partial [Bdellovibrionota bacterium]|nr:trehalose-phosphatase [Bdellovibrionota bacterium]
MKEVFAPEARKKLKAMGLERALYAFDFDGTLSGVVARPDEAKMRATTRELLGVLARRVPVAIVSGRAVADLRQHVMGIPARLIGNHGLEGIGLGPEALRAARRVCKDWVRELKDPIFGPRVGIELEDKTYTLSVHYRNCPDRRAAKLSILQAASSLQPQPRILPGKCVVNLLPPGAPHKGVALVELMLEYDLHRAFYVG